MTACRNAHEPDVTCADCQPETVDDRVHRLIDQTRELLRSTPEPKPRRSA